MSDKHDSGKKTGRPEKYRPEYCELVRRLMGKGESVAACCAEIGVPRQTFIEWQKRHPEFRDACELGKEDSQRWWEKLAMTIATGAAHQKRKEGETNVDHLKKANDKMIQFLMSRRFPDYYSKVNTESKVTQTIKTVVFETQLSNGAIRQSGNIQEVIEEINVDALIDEVTDEAWKSPNESDFD